MQLGARFSDRDMDIAAPPHLSDLRNRAILLDIDGTILDIAPSPRQVWVPTGLRRILSRLAELTDGALALVSGRSLNDIDLIFSPLQLAAIGGHGVEIRTAAHAEPQIRLGSLSTALKRQFAAVAELGPGILVEDKGYSLALHYRLAPEQGQALLAAVTDICATVPQGTIEMLPGKMVVEVKPTGVTKATAVCELMSYPPFLGRHPILSATIRRMCRFSASFPSSAASLIRLAGSLPTLMGISTGPKPYARGSRASRPMARGTAE